MKKNYNYSLSKYQWRFSIPLFLLLFSLNILGQTSLDMIDYSRVPERKVVNFIELQKNSGYNLFSDLIPTCYEVKDSALFHFTSCTYLIHGSADDVWNEYMTVKPSDAYNGTIVRFGFLYSEPDDKIVYRDDQYDRLKEGQLFFFNIRLLAGLINLGIGDQVKCIDEEHKTILFCYLKNGQTEGTQMIRVSETPDGNSEIIHDTWYKSDSRFRDRFLYPFFHKRSVSEYHRMIRRRVEKHAGSGSKT